MSRCAKTHTTSSVIAPSRRCTCMSAAAGNSTPSSLSSMVLSVIDDPRLSLNGMFTVSIGAVPKSWQMSRSLLLFFLGLHFTSCHFSVCALEVPEYFDQPLTETVTTFARLTVKELEPQPRGWVGGWSVPYLSATDLALQLPAPPRKSSPIVQLETSLMQPNWRFSRGVLA
jgi:hypothetical protein